MLSLRSLLALSLLLGLPALGAWACSGQSVPPATAAPATPTSAAAPSPLVSVSTPQAPSPTPGPCSGLSVLPTPDLKGTPTRIAQGEGTGLFEGPLWLASQNVLLFSDMSWGEGVPPSTIRRLTPPNAAADFLANSGSNGLALDHQGWIVAASHDIQGLSRINPATGARQIIADRFQGQPFNSPNDVTVHRDGTIYFSDPNYQRAGRPSIGKTGIYSITPDGTVRLLDDSLSNPNGVTLAPQQKTLYVADATAGGRVGAYSVEPAGAVGPRTEFATVASPDGMTVDCAGNLYVASHTGGEVVVLDSHGKELGKIPVAPQTTNVAFGGADAQTLYITSGKGLYALHLNLPGWPF